MCAPGGGEGASCFFLGGGRCARGFYCASSSGLCESIPEHPSDPPCHCTRLKNEGESCSDIHECAAGRCKEGRCTIIEPFTAAELMPVCQ
jgi:hypothetical protein